MCRTRIEKSAGCNHMTCGFCSYEFCWACGASSTSADNHFGFMRGCGVGMMDESAKPGSKATNSRCCQILKYIGLVLLAIILYPFFLVLYLPIGIGYFVWTQTSRESCWHAVIAFPVGFIFGIFANICFIPFCLIATICLLVY